VTRTLADTSLAGTSIGIVGAGIGGLSAAAYLARDGADVTVYEQRSEVGGVAGTLVDGEFQFDTGPSWYLMPELFERFFDHFDSQPADYYDLERLDPNYRVYWKDGDSVDVPADPGAAAELFESYEDGGGEAFERYLEQAEEAYEIGMNRFVMANRWRLRDYVSTDVARSGRGINFLGTMDEHVSEYFDHPKLQQLVQYTLVFLGGSPYNTPALYTLMSHVDYGLGVYYPQGGMSAFIDALESVAREQGVEIRTETPVTGLVPSQSSISVDHRGGTTSHDRVVNNAPPAHVERDLLPDDVVGSRPIGSLVGGDGEYWDSRTLAPSAFMLYLGIDGDLDEFEHHTLVLPTDWSDHFESIFEESGWPEDPAYYVNVPSQTDPSVAPEDAETLVVLVPVAPELDDDPEQRERFRDDVLDSLAEHVGVDLHDRIRVEHSACVSDYKAQFNKLGGTALGLAHTLEQTGPMRPGFKVPNVERAYYVGGDVNPGIGVPMCLLSGEHVAEVVKDDVASGGLVDRWVRSGDL
jgi:phytoene desaturase